eukprot:CAMPEP_0118637766 /NCGR_PEP_ID=MMETSP0785-20121206/3325_1 /TAXON_ID=91992 /ORGANISM="Bolidomonas pacifica, Strain CCMP 1866" /LENGTH=513 /DNA_ID=CAMNT_0006528969 /DNA_START=113 /DNA_END=1651 /DNA_ORIENTATION=+
MMLLRFHTLLLSSVICSAFVLPPPSSSTLSPIVSLLHRPSALHSTLYRFYDISVSVDEMMEGNLEDKVKEQVVRGLGRKNCDGVGVSTPEVVRYSFDSRKRTIRKKGGPCWTVVADVEVEGKVKERRGVVERRSGKVGGKDAKIGSPTSLKVPLERRKKVVVIGSGPAGLFAALYLSKMPNVQMTLLERGQPVESRGRDIGALQHRAKMNTESNFAFGEGGAGTWSDGKLTTRIGRNSEGVRNVLERLVEYGAEPSILKYGAPHLGTDNLVRILRRMREDIRSNGGEVVFGAKVVGLIKSACGSRLEGVSVSMGYNGELKTRAGNSVPERPIFTSGRSTSTPITLPCDAAILATGHSARDVYSMLIESNVTVAPKGFAVGFRVEHPQRLVNRWQYGEDWAGRVVTGKRKTDEANGSEGGKGGVPVASYRLATDAASDGVRDRGCYSFCMCPGGQIVPASTTSSTVVVNGMSFSKRDSKFANSAVVVNIEPDDDVLKEWVEEHGVLAGVKFQED